MTPNELNDVLKNHLHWVEEDVDGWETMRANLHGADLRSVNLHEANLCEANLCKVNLCGANLYEANLRRADLRGANLCKANLYGADLREANLCGANLHGADLRKAALCGANLYGTKNVPFIPMACPDFGSFVGWKKVRTESGAGIAKLLIPEEARRSSATGRKCRAEYVDVIEIQTISGEPLQEAAEPWQVEPCIKYESGKRVYADAWDEDRWNECSHGIHFFINRQEAVDY